MDDHAKENHPGKAELVGEKGAPNSEATARPGNQVTTENRRVQTQGEHQKQENKDRSFFQETVATQKVETERRENHVGDDSRVDAGGRVALLVQEFGQETRRHRVSVGNPAQNQVHYAVAEHAIDPGN